MGIMDEFVEIKAYCSELGEFLTLRFIRRELYDLTHPLAANAANEMRKQGAQASVFAKWKKQAARLREAKPRFMSRRGVEHLASLIEVRGIKSLAEEIGIASQTLLAATRNYETSSETKDKILAFLSKE